MGRWKSAGGDDDEDDMDLGRLCDSEQWWFNAFPKMIRFINCILAIETD